MRKPKDKKPKLKPGFVELKEGQTITVGRRTYKGSAPEEIVKKVNHASQVAGSERAKKAKEKEVKAKAEAKKKD